MTNQGLEQQESRWLAVYTKPRWEKKVSTLISAKGIKAWCPTQKVVKQWSDRKKTIDEPLFRGYVFVHVTEAERAKVVTTDGVLNFVFHMGKPAVIRNEEIDTIKNFLKDSSVTNITVHSIGSFEANTEIRVVRGVFMNKQGKVIKQASKKKVYVALETLGQVMIVEFTPQDIARVTA
ncbi:MAG TPA: antitermination protein NusG [Chitinophagaceae bacterium]|nr:antitermination protein NusG [Chitinophagaceae bacterium]HAN40111.1 antitermination protein NusG [Chitinophagaceae bacterium]